VAESSSAASEPGPRPEQSPVRDPAIPPVVPAVYFAVLLAGAWIALAHEILVRQPAAYLDPGFGPPRALVTAAGIASVAAGIWGARRLTDPRRMLGWLLGALSLSSTVAAPLLTVAFAKPAFALAATALPAIVGFLLGATLETARVAAGRTVLRLGAVEYLLNPFRLFGLALCFGGAAAGAALIGLLRSSAMIGLVLAALAIWCPLLLEYLERQALAGAGRQRATGAACFALGLAALGAAELVVPLEEQAFFEGDIVYASRGSGRRHFVLSVQDSFELFHEHSLRFSTLDQHRYFEALVQPAIAAAPGARRVLVLGSGDGMAERELLRHPEVEEVTVVVADRALADLARAMPWLTTLNERALSSPRVTLTEDEPLVYLQNATLTFDLALVDLPDPEGYAEGKHYTRHFFQLLGRRLSRHGALCIQTMSPFSTPRSAGSVVATLRAAGFEVLPYTLPLPTLGEWGFALASLDRLPQPQKLASGRFLTPEVFAGMTDPGRDARPAAGAPPSYLYGQAVVTLYEEETALLMR
jgi:spermidine synthase